MSHYRTVVQTNGAKLTPNSEVRPAAKRRTFNCRVQAEHSGGGRPLSRSWCGRCAAATQRVVFVPPGGEWRRQRASGELQAGATKLRGRKPTAEAQAAARLQRGNERLRGQLAQVELIIGVPKKLALALGDNERALAYVAALADDDPHPLIEQDMDPSSLYMICCTVLDTIGEPWAEQMLVRVRRLLAEQAGLIADEDLRRAFCENIALHRQLLTLGKWNGYCAALGRTYAAGGDERGYAPVIP